VIGELVIPSGVRRPMRPLGERLRKYIEPEPNTGCWLWLGFRDRQGYGHFGGPHTGLRGLAHRLMYVLTHGPIPPGHMVDHRCRVRWCCNPAHLEAVTAAENNRRSGSPTALNMLKHACPQGHPYDDTNTWRDAQGRRKCRACRSAYDRRRWASR
jgi:hypothetical protein